MDEIAGGLDIDKEKLKKIFQIAGVAVVSAAIGTLGGMRCSEKKFYDNKYLKRSIPQFSGDVLGKAPP